MGNNQGRCNQGTNLQGMSKDLHNRDLQGNSGMEALMEAVAEVPKGAARNPLNTGEDDHFLFKYPKQFLHIYKL